MNSIPWVHIHWHQTLNLNMNAPEWLNHGIHVYPLHPTTVECSKTWNPLTWPLSVPPEARKDDLGLLERTVLPKGVCQPQVIVNQRHGSWINSLGSFKMFQAVLKNICQAWESSPPMGCIKGIRDCCCGKRNNILNGVEGDAECFQMLPPPPRSNQLFVRLSLQKLLNEVQWKPCEKVWTNCIVPVVTLWEPSKSSVTSLPKSPQKSLVWWSWGTTNN